MEARPGRRDTIGAVQLLEAGAGIAPFIGVAHQDGRHLLRRPWIASRIARTCRRRHRPERTRCMPITAERPVDDQQLGHHSPPRFQRWQVERRDVDHIADCAFHQQRIAVPAEVAGIDPEQLFGMLPPEDSPAFDDAARETAPAFTWPWSSISSCGTAAPRPPIRLSASCSATTSASISGGRGAPGRAAVAGRSRSPCAYYSWRR